MKPWMIYGANGYTGTLIAAAAAAAGMHPLLAGRDRETVGPLAQRLGLGKRIFPLLGQRSITASLEGMDLVLNCAGPFSATAAPLLEACLANGAHYLDISGEIDSFAHCHAQHERAQAADIVVLPGVGFDVVPTDCVALMLKHMLPRADELILAIEGGGGMSPGTARTSLEGARSGGRARMRGQLQPVPLAWKTRGFTRDGQTRLAVTIPWGDLYTAWVSTGIANIETYMVLPPRAIATLKRMRWLRPLLGFKPVTRYLLARIARDVSGPDAETRARSRSHVWGEARSADGSVARIELDAPNGYALTVDAALAIVQRMLLQPPASGYWTPAQWLGAEFVLGLPGVQRIATAA
ncbi:MAG: saccharopine dehydrogenase NADP-binding domain-containing protein [Metallibacterium scheffleri]|jgi:short subunit dehydrogenase-like uncharacterized protein|uniref:saccharopine dehydrogenase family protein n=1 Tax=Metallibacterium scheffleri TaxID=993689 RepID=UPI0026E97E45|nr:saccharopine dehydrogenase NADP-binding domain-containing protein [Metallibacterium scheffleri]MCK9366660.1 saccharopine dehydrogenase NADP-binding domain-containing protein [Metallibacterium scheffleri]